MKLISLHLSLSGLLLFLSGCVSINTKSEPEATPYFFVVAADPQLYYKQKDDSNWKETIAKINSIHPDFVIVCGDMLNLRNNPKKWPKGDEIKAYDKLAEIYLNTAKQLKAEIPIHHVPGNHDVSTHPTPETLQWYRRHFGEPWYSFEHKNSLFLVLESNLLKNPSGAPLQAKKQWDWLDKTLEMSKHKDFNHRTAYMHHPLCTKTVDEKDSYYNLQKPVREKILKRLHQHQFNAVFCGHLHRNAQVIDGDLEIVITASCGAPLGKDPLGFRVVKVFPDRLEHQYYGLKDLPKQIDLNPSITPE